MSGPRWTDSPSEADIHEFYEKRHLQSYVAIKALTAEMPPPEPLLGCFSRSQVVFIAGAAGSGKSMLAMSMVAAVASQHELGSWPAVKTDEVRLGLYIDAELTPHDLQSRMEYLKCEYAPVVYDHCMSRDRMNLDPFSLGNPEHQSWLMNVAANHDVICVDNVTFTLDPAPGCNLYSPETINQMRPLFNWARNQGKLLLLVDHTNHDGRLAGSLNKQRLADVVMLLEQRPLGDDEAAAFTIKWDKWRGENRPRRELDCTLDQHGWDFQEVIPLPDQIRDLIRQGCNNKEIAEELECSTRYVNKIRRSVGR